MVPDEFRPAPAWQAGRGVSGNDLRAQARATLVKACLILATAVAVAIRIAWHVVHPVVPVLDVMGLAAVDNLIANGVCLYLLTPHRHGNVNMASVWECSRNDVIEGVAVIVAAVGVGLFKSGWPDLVIGAILLVVFLRPALCGTRVPRHTHCPTQRW